MKPEKYGGGEEQPQKNQPNKERDREQKGAYEREPEGEKWFERETEQDACATCGMPKNEWTFNDNRGYAKGRQTYCCQGCAENTGCTCDSARSGGDEIAM